jgi:hypothetical protein
MFLLRLRHRHQHLQSRERKEAKKPFFNGRKKERAEEISAEVLTLPWISQTHHA